MNRPVGVTILAVLAFIGGIFGILGGLGLIAGGALLAGAGATAGVSAKAGGLVFVFGIVLLVIGVLDIVLGVGFWKLKPWAWALGVGLQVVGLVLTGVEIATKYTTIAGSALGIAVSLFILIYLFTPGVRGAFGRA